MDQLETMSKPNCPTAPFESGKQEPMLVPGLEIPTESLNTPSESWTDEFGIIPEEKMQIPEEQIVSEVTDKNTVSTDSMLMPPPPPPQQGQLEPPLKQPNGGVRFEPIMNLALHDECCVYAMWVSHKNRLMTLEEVRCAFMEVYMRRKSWNNPTIVAEASRKCEEVLAEDGLVMWYLQSQKDTLENMKKHIRGQCLCRLEGIRL